MSEDKRYNGWTNYETWLIKLWIDNDEGSYLYWKEIAQDAYDNPAVNQYMELDRRRVHVLVERLKDEHEERCQEASGENGFVADLLNAALCEVNWYEIAESLLEDVDKNEETEYESEAANV